MSKNPKSSRRTPAKGNVVKSKKQSAAALPLRPTLLPAPRLITDRTAWPRILRDLAGLAAKQPDDDGYALDVLAERAGEVVIAAFKVGHLHDIPGIAEAVADATRPKPDPLPGVEVVWPSACDVMHELVGQGPSPGDVDLSEDGFDHSSCNHIPVYTSDTFDDPGRGLLSIFGFPTEGITDDAERFAYGCGVLAALLETEMARTKDVLDSMKPSEFIRIYGRAERKDIESEKTQMADFKTATGIDWPDSRTKGGQDIWQQLAAWSGYDWKLGKSEDAIANFIIGKARRRDHRPSPTDYAQSKYAQTFADSLAITTETLNDYAKKVGVETPARGEHDFQYPLASQLAILKHATKHASKSKTRKKAEALLAGLANPN